VTNENDPHNLVAGLPTADMSVEDLLSFVNDFPALLWRIEIAKSRIEFLNNNYIVSQGLDGKLLLKNIRYRQEVVLSEDEYLINAFMEAVKQSKTAATVFRVRTEDHKTIWLKLTGATNSWDPRYYYGFLLNITDTVEMIKSIVDKDINLQLLVDDIDNPTLLLDFETRCVLHANTTVCDLFRSGREDLEKLTFDDLYRESMRTAVSAMLDQIPLDRKWSGKLDFYQHGKRRIFTAETIVRYLVYGNRSLLRISFINPQITAPHRSRPTLPQDLSLRHDLARCLEQPSKDITTVLETVLFSPLVAGRFDAVMFSDVHVKKNKVYVYAAGTPSLDIKNGAQFAYKGTIAEDINHFSLDHLTVDDTQESIKPIDWALFVPQGIRSYFARPFYSRKALRTVLILCSRTPGAFNGSTSEDFDDLFTPLNEAIKSWRRSLRD
jgi:hypothetical protein